MNYRPERTRYTSAMPDFHLLQAALRPIQFMPHLDAPPAGLQDYAVLYQLTALPAPHAIGTVQSNQFQLAVQYWLPENASKTVLIAHGYYDHMGLYGHIVQHFLEHGYAVLGFDLPGHGLSSGERASIATFDHYGDAIADVLSAAKGQLPPVTVAVGQSTGCAALLNGLMRQRLPELPQLILLAPLLRPGHWVGYGEWIYVLVHRWLKHMPRRFNANTHDAAFLNFCQQDPLQVHQLSVQWVRAMKHWLDNFARQPTVPVRTLLIQGKQDTTVDWRYNVPQLIQKLPNCQTEYLPDALHHLVNETPAIRSQLWQLMDDFLLSPTR